jgi:hypothetical protein
MSMLSRNPNHSSPNIPARQRISMTEETKTKENINDCMQHNMVCVLVSPYHAFENMLGYY